MRVLTPLRDVPMSYKESSYIAKPVDADGFVHYTEEENETWQILMTRQLKVLPERACDEFMEGLAQLNLPLDRVPQGPEVSAVLQKATGWMLEPVPALISFDRFFALLADRRFPAATFIRRREELDYLKEPDIFHEIFGHCPLLTNQAYADFTQRYGQLALDADKADRALLARIYWFTIEFGLLKSSQGLRIYGGGILSSFNETHYALDGSLPEYQPFDVLNALRTPFRIDIMQPVYFVLNELSDLFHLLEVDLIALIHQARELGEFPPLFEKKLRSNP